MRFTFALLPFKNIVRRQLHCEVRSINISLTAKMREGRR